MSELLQQFHFLRPWWLAALLLLPPLGWLGVRRNDGAVASQSLDSAISIPSFTVYDAMASYRFKAAERDYTAQLNVKNLTNAFYRDNADGFIGDRRRIFLSVATKF